MARQTYLRRHYGKCMVFIVYVVIAFIQKTFDVQLVYNQLSVDYFNHQMDYFDARALVLKINAIAFILFPALFLFLTRRFYSRIQTLFLWLFIVFIGVSQFFFISFLSDLYSLENNFQYDSDFGIIGIIIFPVNLIYIFTLAILFDLMKNKSYNSNL